MTYAVKLPRVFFVDHLSRCITRDVVTRSTSKGITADLEGFEVAELLSDAGYWSTEWVQCGDPSLVGFGSSARATLAAIRRQFDASQLEQFHEEWREVTLKHQAAYRSRVKS